MWSSTLLLLAAGLTAVAGHNEFGRHAAWDEVLSRLMAVTSQGELETGKCDDHCYIINGTKKQLLKQDAVYTNPGDPCNPYICEGDGVNQKETTCPDKEEPCTNGEPPIILPGTCCPKCQGGPSTTPDTFSMWGEWTECSKTCNGGARARRRRCLLTDSAEFVTCTGTTLQDELCNTQPCAVHCEWKWGEYEECSVTCGQGTKKRYPEITIPEQHGGRPCPVDVVNNVPETELCQGRRCPVPCVWRQWSEWHSCSVTCGGGTEIRTRTQLPAQYGGPNCQGQPTESKQCLLEECKESACPNGYNTCEGKCIPDKDHDCVDDNEKDNCPDVHNVDQADDDKDGRGNKCDNCPDHENSDQSDNDNDGDGDECDHDDDNDRIFDYLDNCQFVPNPGQSRDDPAKYGSRCTTPNSGATMTDSDRKGLAASIMEKLLEMYYSNK